MSKQPISRNSSIASVGSDASVPSVTRRTRKRFTNEQLAMLEGLYHQNSHPSRAERENLAKEAGMETKNVTVWLQNKRQNDRKNALQGVAATTRVAITPAVVAVAPTPIPPQRLAISSLPPTSARSQQPPSQSSHISLDRVASRSELRVPSARSSHSRRHNPTAAIWDSMPPSPENQHNDSPSPPSTTGSSSRGGGAGAYYKRELGARPTLEWACANASAQRHLDQRGDETDEEEEEHEAITPQHSLSRDDPVWTVKGKARSHGSMVIGEQDDETMGAALALCRLGGRAM